MLPELRNGFKFVEDEDYNAIFTSMESLTLDEKSPFTDEEMADSSDEGEISSEDD